MQEVKVGVVGCGRWGSNFIRVLSSMEGCRLLGVLDTDPRHAQKAARGDVKAFSSVEKMVKSVKLDAVVIASPASAHRDVAIRCMKAGAHVLVEKPLATAEKDCIDMGRAAKACKKILMVGHIFHYNRGVQKMKSIVDSGEIGDLRYMYCVRTNLGPIRDDVNVLWDLAAHDASIMMNLVGEVPSEVTASGQSYLRRGIADVAFGTLFFRKRNIMGHLQVSWLDPHKMRILTIIGTDKMAVFDDVNTQEPIRIFNRGVMQDKVYDDFGHFQMVLRDGDISIPHVVLAEPLRSEANHFMQCIRNGEKPLTGIEHGTDVVRVLLALDESLRLHGKPVRIKGA